MELTGVFPIVPTPLDASGDIDVASLRRLATFVMQSGSEGPVVLGVMGEAPLMSETERALVVKTMRSALPESTALVVGVQAAGTRLAVEAAYRTEAWGANALLLGPPPVQSDGAILDYYRQVAEAIDIPIIIHDYPASSGVLMPAPLISRLFGSHRNIRYLKLEDPPTGLKMAQLQSEIDGGLGIFGALGGMYIFEELDRGACGIMTGFAYPEFLVSIFRHYRQGDADTAARIFYDILPLIRFEFQPRLGVSLRKHTLVRRGIFKTDTVRQPAMTPDAKTVEQLQRILDHLRDRGYSV